jgi:lipopolysaccharide export system protein LptA
MKVYVNPDGTRNIHISSTNGESDPTGTIDGNVEIRQGDNLIDDDTKTIKVFNGSSWIAW